MTNSNNRSEAVNLVPEKAKMDPDLQSYIQDNFYLVFHMYREVMEKWEQLPESLPEKASVKSRMIGNIFRQLYGKTTPGSDRFWQITAVETLFQNFGSRVENANTMEQLLQDKFDFQRTILLPPESIKSGVQSVEGIIDSTRQQFKDKK